MITLYYSPSTASLVVHWLLIELGVPHELKKLDFDNRDQKSADYLKLNPAGQAPVAVFADGRALAQSNAIMLHLAEGSVLIPGDAFARAKMFEWMFWEQYSHEPTIAVRIARKYYLKQTDEQLDPSLLVKGNAALARLELQLRATPYLVGEAISLADVALVAYTRVAHRGGFDLDAYPAVRDWVRRIEAALGVPPAE